MITIRDIAEISGLSVSTVSRVINNQPRVSNESRKKILDIIEQYEYVPNSKAVSLSIGKSFTIGVVIPYSNGNSYYNTIVNGIIEEGFKNKYKVTFLPTNYEKDLEISYLKLLSSKEFDSLIIVSSSNTFEEIQKYTKYGRIVCCEDVGAYNLCCVYIERNKAFAKILNYLKNQEYKRVGITFSRNEKLSVASRKVVSTFINIFGDFPDEWIFRNCRKYEDGYNAGRHYNQLEYPIEAILTNGDEVAAGIYQYYVDHSIPSPIIIGQDNMSVGKILGLPTIDFHIDELGREAVRLCLSDEMIKKNIPYDFIKRDYLKN